MDIVFPVLGILFGLGIPILIIVGVVYFILKIRSGISIRFSYRAALRIYFYVVILISVGLGGLGGVSTLFLLPVIYLAAPGRPATPGLNRISKLILLSTQAAPPCTYRAIRCLDNPMVGAGHDFIEFCLISRRGDYATVDPILNRLKGHLQFSSKLPYA